VLCCCLVVLLSLGGCLWPNGPAIGPKWSLRRFLFFFVSYVPPPTPAVFYSLRLRLPLRHAEEKKTLFCRALRSEFSFSIPLPRSPSSRPPKTAKMTDLFSSSPRFPAFLVSLLRTSFFPKRVRGAKKGRWAGKAITYAVWLKSCSTLCWSPLCSASCLGEIAGVGEKETFLNSVPPELFFLPPTPHLLLLRVGTRRFLPTVCS